MSHKSIAMGLGLGMGTVGTAIVALNQLATAMPQQIAQDGSQAVETRIMDLGVSQSQLQQMKSIGMKMVMPKNVPPGFRLANILSQSNERFGPSYLLVYRKDRACFGVEGTSGGIGGIPAGTKSHVVRNAVLGKGQIEEQSGDPRLIGQWMGRGPFYRFVGANYRFNDSSELVGCQNVSPKEAVFVGESLRYLDLETAGVQPVPVAGSNSSKSTVTKYPTDKELSQFKQKLKSGAFGNGIKLSSADRTQRQAYQSTWAKMNPTGAKFVGAWQAGDRYYYVYPSKVKSRVCVVTKAANGKAEFSNGQAISRELRYQSNGLFWIDQADILAARDAGTGQLYPVFAVQSTPDPADLTNFNFGFNHAECAMELSGK